jgi:hypothetical protein
VYVRRTGEADDGRAAARGAGTTWTRSSGSENEHIMCRVRDETAVAAKAWAEPSAAQQML